ncbi:hypothetical protein [Nocardia sp. CA-119907]|uniref:hypothetical protein n=1 Tax=Nocardia sp. CA-119907 TaxID=3239973 RepID=UPI003D983ABA
MNTFWEYAGGPLLGIAITVVFWLMVWVAVSVARVRSGGRSRLGRVNVFDATLRPSVPTPMGPMVLVWVPIVACGVVLKALGVIPDWGLAAIVVGGAGVAATVSRVRFLMGASTSNE